MRNFILGVIVGATGALWYSQTMGRMDVERQFAQMQERANAVLNESRRILEETRQELASALEAGKQTVQQRTERFRTSGPGDGETGESTPPAS
jgi:streptogramin lyase